MKLSLVYYPTILTTKKALDTNKSSNRILRKRKIDWKRAIKPAKPESVLMLNNCENNSLLFAKCLKILQRSIFKLSRDLIRQTNRTFNGFLSDFVEISSCVYTKTIILNFNLGE